MNGAYAHGPPVLLLMLEVTFSAHYPLEVINTTRVFTELLIVTQLVKKVLNFYDIPK
jgi:hypothetical protein